MKSILDSPKVLTSWLAVLLIIWLIGSGIVVEFGRLYSYQNAIKRQTVNLVSEMNALNLEIAKSKNQEFIQRQAIEHLGMASEEDLIFLFF